MQGASLLGIGGKRYSVEFEAAPGKPEPREVALRFGPRGVSTGGDEFGGATRLPSAEWMEIDGIRVRVSDQAEADENQAANSTDWTKPELLISTPGGDHIRRLRLVLPGDEGSDMLLGRSGRKNDVILEDEHVSRRHVRVIVRGGRHVLEDLGSRWGTFINGARVDRPTPLAHGDEILAGKTVMRFVKFSDGLDIPAGSSAGSVGRSVHSGPSWKPDPANEDAMTLTATTLLSIPAPSEDSPRPMPGGSGERAEDEASISQKLTGWMRKKER